MELVREKSTYVGRGGDKMAHALAVFDIDVSGARVIDLGASTGGFSDCLLQAGAANVVAVDVGYGQLDFNLREDKRVTVLERTNVRLLDPSEVGAPFDLVVADLSFISLELVMNVIAGLMAQDGQAVLLVKPQFEVGKGQVGRGGVVDDPDLWRQSIMRIIDAGRAFGLGADGLTVSPLRGAASGNREFLLNLRPGEGSTVDETGILLALDDAHELGRTAGETQ